MALLGIKKLGKSASADRADTPKSHTDQVATSSTQKPHAQGFATKPDASRMQDELSKKKAVDPTATTMEPVTPGKDGVFSSSAWPQSESTPSHSRSHSFDLRRKLRMPSNMSLGSKSSFGFRRVRTGTDTARTSAATLDGSEATEGDPLATLVTPKGKPPGTPSGHPSHVGSSSISLRSFRSKDSVPSTPKSSGKGKGKARESDIIPPLPAIDPERFPNLASKTSQAAPHMSGPLEDYKPGDIVLLPRTPGSAAPTPFTPSASSQRAVTSPLYSELERSSKPGGIAPSISGAGLNLSISSFKSPTATPSYQRSAASQTPSETLPPYLMEKLSLEPSSRIPLQPPPAEIQGPATSTGATNDKANTSGLSGFVPPKGNPLSYLLASKDSKDSKDSETEDLSTVTVIQRPVPASSAVDESGAALEDEDESLDGTHVSHTPTVMYDADEFLETVTAMESHDEDDSWYAPPERPTAEAVRSSQDYRKMPGFVPSDFGHVETPAWMPAMQELDENVSQALPHVPETIPNVVEVVTVSQASEHVLLEKESKPQKPAPMKEKALPSEPASSPSADEAILSSKDEPASEPDKEAKPTLLGSLSEALSQAGSAGMAMLVGSRNQPSEPASDAAPMEDGTSSTASIATNKPPVPPRMRPPLTSPENASETLPKPEAPSASEEAVPTQPIVPVVPLSLPPKSASVETGQMASRSTRPRAAKELEKPTTLAKDVPDASGVPPVTEDPSVPPSTLESVVGHESSANGLPMNVSRMSQSHSPSLPTSIPQGSGTPAPLAQEGTEPLAQEPSAGDQLDHAFAPEREDSSSAQIEPVLQQDAEPVTESVPESAAEPVAEPAPVTESVPESVAEPVVESVPESAAEPVTEPAPVAEAVPESVAEAVPESLAKPVAEPAPVAESVPESAAEPVVESVPESVAKPVAEPAPVAEPVPESAAEPVAESVPESATEPVAEPAPVAESVPESATEPVTEPAPVAEAVPESLAKPVPESVPESVAKPVSEPAPVVESTPESVAKPVVEAVPESMAKPVAEPALVAESVPESAAEPVTEPAPVAESVPESVASPATELAAEPTPVPIDEVKEPAIESKIADLTMERAVPDPTEAPVQFPTVVADEAPSSTLDAPTEATTTAAVPVDKAVTLSDLGTPPPPKVPLVQSVPTPVSKPVSFLSPSLGPPWSSISSADHRMPQLPPVLGKMPEVPQKDKPVDIPLPAGPPMHPRTPEPIVDRSEGLNTPAKATDAPLPAPTESARPDVSPAAGPGAEESSNKSASRLSSVLNGGLLSSAALPAFFRKKDTPVREKSRDSVPEPSPEPSSGPASVTVTDGTAPLAPTPAPSAPAVSNVGPPWSYLSPAPRAPEPAAESVSVPVPSTQPPAVLTATGSLSGQPKLEPKAELQVEPQLAPEPVPEPEPEPQPQPQPQPAPELQPAPKFQPQLQPQLEPAADMVPWKAPVWPVAARSEAPLPDTPADTSASHGPLPWNLANAPFLPSAQTRFFESEHQLPHWNAPVEAAASLLAPVDDTQPLPKLVSEPVVAPYELDEEPDVDWDSEQPSRRYAIDPEPAAEPSAPFLQTVPEEQGEATADPSVPEAHDAPAQSHGPTEEALRPAPALRGKGVYDPYMLSHFMRAMDESDYGRAVHRASMMGVSLEEIPSVTPPATAPGASDPPRPSELFAGKGVRWDSPDWLRSRLDKVEAPSQHEFQAFLKQRRQVTPAFAWQNARSERLTSETTEDAAEESVPAAAAPSLLDDWENTQTQPIEVRFSKLLLPSDSYLMSDLEPIDTSLLSLEQLEKSYQGKARVPDSTWSAAAPVPPVPPEEDVPPAVPPKSHLNHSPLRAVPASVSPARRTDLPELTQHLEQARRRQAAQYEQYDREQAQQRQLSVLSPSNDDQEFYDEFGGTRPLYELEAAQVEDRPTAAISPGAEPVPRQAQPHVEPSYEAVYAASGPSAQSPTAANPAPQRYEPHYQQGYEYAGYQQGYSQPEYAVSGQVPQGYAPQGYAESGYATGAYAPQNQPQAYGGYVDPQYASYGYSVSPEGYSYPQGSYAWDAYGHGQGVYPSAGHSAAYPDPNQPTEPYGVSPGALVSPVDLHQPRVAQSVSLTPLSKLGIPPAHQLSDSPFPQTATGPMSMSRDPMDMPFKPPTPKKGTTRSGAHPMSPASLPGDVPSASRHRAPVQSARSTYQDRSGHRRRASGSRSGWAALLNTDLSRS